MKYKIGDRVFNSEQIVKVQYFAGSPDDTDPNEHECAVGIKTVCEGQGQWSAWLRGDHADRFWEVYTGDALDVDAEAQHHQAPSSILLDVFRELDDLCPRMSDDDPVAPAIADALKRARAAIAASEARPAPASPHEYIARIATENTGGGVMVDVVTLKSGKVLTITDEMFGLWSDIEAWRNTDGPDDAMFSEV